MTLAQAGPDLQRGAGRTHRFRIRFCSRCGTLFPGKDVQPDVHGHERVCTECGMGILLACPRDAMLTPQSAFLIATRDLRVSAVSEPAEGILAPESDMVGTGLLQWMSSPLGADELAAGVARAARGTRQVTVLPVHVASHRSRRLGPLEATIASCGPPRGALLVIERVSTRDL
jgi:ribosomal protein S27AE